MVPIKPVFNDGGGGGLARPPGSTHKDRGNVAKQPPNQPDVKNRLGSDSVMAQKRLPTTFSSQVSKKLESKGPDNMREEMTACMVVTHMYDVWW